ncbi:hypothetical protein [Chitinophaga japonensis]|uniref:Uncharacterized protein n=1 Tax=Chitinophaga japonensis TaxID=104662 RepID=A0A562T0D7_CHIJA|nr:hypothetical protein [Chitinophaga japonensis]TWI86768.1 hypothetical protein LX66_4032 [Chitinophaga japonensis]
MAILDDGIHFTGSVGPLSAYRMKGSDKIILRRKGGASKARIQQDPSFQRTREHNMEFSGRAKAAKVIRRALTPVKHLADYNFTPWLIALCGNIQQQDLHSERGQRNIYLSKHRHLLPGFKLNQRHPFDSVLRYPLAYAMDRATPSAQVEIPALIPGLHLVLPWTYPLYRFVISLGLAGDMIYNGNGYREPPPGQPGFAIQHTAWQAAAQPFDGANLELQLSTPAGADDTLVLCAGIEMGMPVTDAFTRPARRAGAAGILAVG